MTRQRATLSGLKTPMAASDFFLSRRKTEVAWVNLSTPIALNGTEPILRANSRSFTINSILLIAEQNTHLPAISAK